MNVYVQFKKNSYTQDQYFIVSQEDHAEVSKYNWYLDYDGRGHYRVVRKATKIELSNGYPHLIKLHRFVMGVAQKGQEKVFVDHKNHNVLDNSRNNLRLATPYGNSTNSRGNKYQSLWGTTLDKSGKWRAQITFKGKTVYVGLFTSELEAHKASVQRYTELRHITPNLTKFVNADD